MEQRKNSAKPSHLVGALAQGNYSDSQSKAMDLSKGERLFLGSSAGAHGPQKNIMEAMRDLRLRGHIFFEDKKVGSGTNHYAVRT